MSDRFAYFYQPLKEFDLRRFVSEWAGAGVVLFNPSNHLVTSLSEDGSQVRTSLEELEDWFNSSKPLVFQLCLSDDTDLLCCIRIIDEETLVEQYGLDGLNPTELKSIIGTLVAKFKRKATRQVNDLFLIIDSEGYTIDLNWDLLAKAEKYEDHFCPDVLGISPTRASDFSQCLERDVVTQVGEYLIISKTMKFDAN
jgi:hypothetical protein